MRWVILCLLCLAACGHVVEDETPSCPDDVPCPGDIIKEYEMVFDKRREQWVRRKQRMIDVAEDYKQAKAAYQAAVNAELDQHLHDGEVQEIPDCSLWSMWWFTSKCASAQSVTNTTLLLGGGLFFLLVVCCGAILCACMFMQVPAGRQPRYFEPAKRPEVVVSSELTSDVGLSWTAILRSHSQCLLCAGGGCIFMCIVLLVAVVCL